MKWRGAAEVCKRAKISFAKLKKAAEDDFNDEKYELADRIEAIMTSDEKDAVATEIERVHVAEAPTWKTMSYESIVKPSTWLIHFSDDAGSIMWKGFKYGSDDMTKLALTTYWTKEAKRYGGYNFAFEAEGRHARAAAKGRGKYGREAVMFQAAGVKAFHWGDEEDQVMFWGPSVDPRRMVLLTRDGDLYWCVASVRNKRDVVYRGEFTDTVNWVIKNFPQYRKAITVAG